MTQEDKNLLLKDLCARLPHWPNVLTEDNDKGHIIGVDDTENGVFVIHIIEDGDSYTCDESIENFKPYLRPMSSMTEEDLRDFAQLKFKNNEIWEIDDFPKMKFGFKGFINIRCKNKHSEDTWIFQITTRSPLENYLGIDWINAHHFDYRGLIEKGLALEAKEGMYK